MWPWCRPSSKAVALGADSAVNSAIDVSLDELIAMRYRNTAFRRRLTAENFRPGERRGRRRGLGLDLDNIGPYQPGDDIRHIDWLATARTGRTQTKHFRVEMQHTVVLITDLRQSMYFGTKSQYMAKTACLATARLAWHLTASHQPLSIVRATDTNAHVPRPERGRRAKLRQLKQLADSYRDGLRKPAGETTTLSAALGNIDAELPRDAEIIVISHFSELGNQQQIHQQRLWRRSLLAVIIDDEILQSLPRAGTYPIHHDQENASTLVTTRSSQSREYSLITEQLRHDLVGRLAQLGIQSVARCAPNSPNWGL